MRKRELKRLYAKAWRHAPAVGKMHLRRMQRCQRMSRHYQRISRHWDAVTKHYEALTASNSKVAAD